jgi:hydrogenase expression/formation protein HypC
MCLGIPGEILEMRNEKGIRFAKVKFAGITRDVCIECIPEAALGDYVLVHVGFAISMVDREEAARAYRALDEMGLTAELRDDRANTGQQP